MLPRILPIGTASALIALATSQANAAGAWIASSDVTPVEQRVALAVGPTTTTLWTSLSFETYVGGAIAIVLPAPQGSSLDTSSPAWFEALEAATSPRILPPTGLAGTCPGGAYPSMATGVEIADPATHVSTVAPTNAALLQSLADVRTWAAKAQLTVPESVASALAALAPTPFVALLYHAPVGVSATSTLRITSPTSSPLLPLSLVHAGAQELPVTAWVFGSGRAALATGRELVISSSLLAWDAKAQTANYTAVRASTLSGVSGAYLLESSGHDILSDPLTLPMGAGVVDSFVDSYFSLAQADSATTSPVAACASTAGASLDSTNPVAAVCPRGALGVVGTTPLCVEAPPTSAVVDPSSLRCGPVADDLAVALSGAVPANTWLTRLRLSILAGTRGSDWAVRFVGGPSVVPVVQSGSVDPSSCAGGSSATTQQNQGGSSGSVGNIQININSGGSSDGQGSVVGSSGDESDWGGSVDVSTGDSTDTSVSTGDGSCGSSDGSTADSSAGSCGSSDGAGASDGCSGASGVGDAASGCSGGGADFGSCSVRPSATGRRRPPKLSLLLVVAIGLVAPLRRRNRRRAKTTGNGTR